MVAMRQIEEVGQRIGREFRPDRVILFGSHAGGTAGSGSDVDLLVIMPFEGKSVAKSVEVRLKINPPFPVDLLVRTPQMVQKRLDMGDNFMRNILQLGKVLYEASGR